MAEPAVDPGAPPPPRPGGVVDLARYRGRAVAPVVVPPPRPDQSAPVTPRPTPAREPSRRRSLDRGRVVEERVIRRLRLGSVLKLAFGLSLCTVLVVLGAGVLVWVTISSLGVVENLEGLAEDLGWVDVRFDGPAMLRSASIVGGILIVASTFLAVVFAEVFNLLSTITGGLRAEVGPPPPTRRERRAAKKEEKARKAASS